MIKNMNSRWVILAILLMSVLVTACGASEVEPNGELSLLNEQGEEVTLTNKDRATILFHFTEVG